MTKGSRIQILYDFCKKALATPKNGIFPPLIEKLCSMLDAINPADVGLEEDKSEDDRGYGFFWKSVYGKHSSSRVGRWTQPITYLDICDNDNFTIGIFCLPTSSVIPLHDHPGMTVLSKILYGSLHVKAYDWVEPAYAQKVDGSDGFLGRLAKLQVDTVLTAPCHTTVLYPKTGGNIHCFTAVASCAVLDVLAPPYSEAAGRTCTYYHDYPYTSCLTNGASMLEPQEDYAWLKAIEAPASVCMRPGIYNGPAIHH